MLDKTKNTYKVTLSDSLVDLLTKMLELNPQDRPSIDTILESRWF